MRLHFQKYEGKFLNCLIKCRGDVEELLQLVTSEFPSFEDVAEYDTVKGEVERSFCR